MKIQKNNENTKNNTRFDEIIQNLAKKNESLLFHNS